jgi:hypothetical protein
MHTTMNVTGRPAQFGRGVMVEVGGKLVEQFAQNLRQQIIGDSATSADAPAGTEAAGAGAAEAAAGTAGTATAGTATVGDGAEADASAGQPSATAADQTRNSVPPVTAPLAGTAPAPPTAAAPDSINLVRLVGPAILKRVVPVAAALAALTLLGRRLFRRGAKK